MDWKHEVSEQWLLERRDVLTASEAVKLIPEYKRMTKSGAELALGFAALWEEKTSSSKPDRTSFGAAARGHIMEPWALAEYNSITPGDPMWHWDDAIIKRDGMGYSPDGLDVMPPVQDACWSMTPMGLVSKSGCKERAPKKLIEIKCYEPGHHAKCMISHKSELNERYQIAFGMLVVETIEKGTLLLYNPSTRHPVVIKEYSRDELSQEIELMSNIAKAWKKTCLLMSEYETGADCLFSEEEIWENWYASEYNERHTSILDLAP